MHDPHTLAWDIKSPFKQYRKIKSGKRMFKNGYRKSLVSIWHVDPERDGTDDSCGWFMRSRHGDGDTLERIIKRFSEDWDRVFVSDATGKTYYCGLFYPVDSGAGMPNMGVTAVALNLFFIAAMEHFKVDGNTNWKKARKWMQKNLFDIMFFAENPTDSLRDAIVLKWGDSDSRETRIRSIASCIYGWILRNDRPWYKHPRFHIHHWKIQVHFTQNLKRWLFSRCAGCGKGFKWGHSVCTSQWNGTGPKWFKSEQGVYHDQCMGNAVPQQDKSCS